MGGSVCSLKLDDLEGSPISVQPKSGEPSFRISDYLRDAKTRTLKRIDIFLSDCLKKITPFESINGMLWSARGSEHFAQFLLTYSLQESPEGYENSVIQAAFRILLKANTVNELCAICNVVNLDAEFCRKVLLELYPMFLESEIYKRWRQRENEDAMTAYENPELRLTVTIPDILEVQESTMCKLVTAEATIGGAPSFSQIDDVHIIPGSVTYGESSDMSFGVPLDCDSSSYLNGTSAANSVLSVISRDNIDDIMKCDSWLFTVLCTMEYAPVSFFVVSVNPGGSGFPMVFANRQYEVTTGHKRRDDIGRNVRYFSPLAPYNYNSMSLAELRSAMQHGQTKFAEFTDFKKNGEPYSTMLIVKPLYSLEGNYKYVLCLQHRDVRNTPSNNSTTTTTRFSTSFSLTRAWLEAIPDSISVTGEK